MQLRGNWGLPGCHRSWKQSKQRNNLFTYVCDSIQHARLWKKHFIDYCGRKQQKQCLLIKTTHAVIYTSTAHTVRIRLTVQ